MIVNVASGTARQTFYFGLDSPPGAPSSQDHASDVKACPRCGRPVTYESFVFGHLGRYQCHNCGLTRPEPHLLATDIETHGISGTRFLLRYGSESSLVHLPLPGLYNVYNAVAAASVGLVVGSSLSTVAKTLQSATPAFGRTELVQIDGRTVFLALAKNPAGLNEILRTIGADGERLSMLVMLNDHTADGRDVSWIWDSDVEMLQGQVASAVFSGVRAEDMALRFKYAGVTPAEVSSAVEIVTDTAAALDLALSRTPERGTLYVVPTYTAMLDIRGVLTRRGLIKAYWEE
jgi:UDP-N-acetylmuramyl tripeptide synthase